MGEVFSCSTVNTSAYGTLSGHLSFLPDIPLAFLGFAFYASIIALGMAVLSDLSTEEQERTHNPAFIGFGQSIQLFSGLAIILSGYLAYISKVHIGAWCLYCIGMYGCNIFLFVAGVFWVRNNRELEGTDSSFQTFVVPFGILSIISLLISTAFPKQQEIKVGEWKITEVAGGAILNGQEAVYGRASTPYMVVEFADFQCGHCAATTPKIKDVITKFSDIVHLRYKHFPLSNACNHNISSTFHTQSCEAAYVAECAAKQGKFWEMSRLLFINGSHLSADNFTFLAQQVQLDTSALDICLQDVSIKERIQKDIQAADILKVQGTPALFLHDGVSWWKIEQHEVGLEKTLLMLKEGKTPPGSQKTNPIQQSSAPPIQQTKDTLKEAPASGAEH